MIFYKYLRSAEKHLYGCKQLFQSYRTGDVHDCHVWLELYYLSGYVIEGIVIYSAYKLNNWPSNNDIKKCNLEFTQRTNLDFYNSRKIKDEGIEKEYFQNRPPGALSVQSHHFQEIAKKLLKTDPSFSGVPYVGDGIIDVDIELLIDEWKPEVRYSYGLAPGMPSLNKNVIGRLLNTCELIYLNHI